MLKNDLHHIFIKFCIDNKFEINNQQVEIINLLDKFINSKKTIFGYFLNSEKKMFLPLWKCGCWQNNDT